MLSKTLNKFFILFSITFFLLSCQKEANTDTSPSIERQIEGTWSKTLIRLEYYDSSNNLDFVDNVTEENGWLYLFDNGSLKLTNSYGEETVSYKLITRNNKNYISLTDGANSVENEVLELSNTIFKWQRNYHTLTYYKNGVKKTAARSLYVEEFKRL